MTSRKSRHLGVVVASVEDHRSLTPILDCALNDNWDVTAFLFNDLKSSDINLSDQVSIAGRSRSLDSFMQAQDAILLLGSENPKWTSIRTDIAKAVLANPQKPYHIIDDGFGTAKELVGRFGNASASITVYIGHQVVSDEYADCSKINFEVVGWPNFAENMTAGVLPMEGEGVKTFRSDHNLMSDSFVILLAEEPYGTAEARVFLNEACKGFDPESVVVLSAAHPSREHVNRVTVGHMQNRDLNYITIKSLSHSQLAQYWSEILSVTDLVVGGVSNQALEFALSGQVPFIGLSHPAYNGLNALPVIQGCHVVSEPDRLTAAIAQRMAEINGVSLESPQFDFAQGMHNMAKLAENTTAETAQKIFHEINLSVQEEESAPEDT